MPKLNDTQAILLSTAAQRDNGSLLPLPASHAEGLAKARAAKAMTALLKLGFLEERKTNTAASVHRTDGDLRFGLYLTAAGKAALGIDDEATCAADQPPAPRAAAPSRPSKTATVIALLQRGTGATTAELIAATGWLPHTTRAALTGLRKKGHAIDRTKRDGDTCYRITAVA